MAACAQVPFVNATLIQALFILCRLGYIPQRWHSTLLMWACLAVPLGCNVFCRRILPPLERLLGVTHVVFFIIPIATLDAMAPHGSNDFVWTTTTTGLSGWKSPGLQWCIGLLTPAFSLVSFDGVLHVGESFARST